MVLNQVFTNTAKQVDLKIIYLATPYDGCYAHKVRFATACGTAIQDLRGRTVKAVSLLGLQVEIKSL